VTTTLKHYLPHSMMRIYFWCRNDRQQIPPAQQSAKLAFHEGE
jgi:hypothetical protein